MRTSWDSEVLRRVPEAPLVLAEAVAVELCEPSPAVVEVVAEFLISLDASFYLGAPALLADQLQWQRTRLAVVAPEIDRTEVAAAVRAALAPHLDAAALDAVDRQIEHARVLAEGLIREVFDLELSPEAQAYLEHILRGDRGAAVQVVTDLVEAGSDPAGVLLGLLEPVQVEIGRLWEQGRVSIAHEHFGTAVTQLCMSILYPHLAQGRVPLQRTAVATNVGGEAHEVGLRIVTDLLERAGWRTAYLGSGVPVDDVLDQLAERRADVLAISATMSGQLHAVKDVIAAVRADPRCAAVKVVVGGRPFQLAPELAATLGADAWAADATGAVEVCNRLVEERAATISSAAGAHPVGGLRVS